MVARRAGPSRPGSRHSRRCASSRPARRSARRTAPRPASPSRPGSAGSSAARSRPRVRTPAAVHGRVHRAQVVQVRGDRLLDQDVLAGPRGGDRLLRVAGVRRADREGVQAGWASSRSTSVVDADLARDRARPGGPWRRRPPSCGCRSPRPGTAGSRYAPGARSRPSPRPAPPPRSAQAGSCARAPVPVDAHAYAR